MSYQEGVVERAEFDESARPVPYGVAKVVTQKGQVEAVWYEEQVQYKAGDKVTLQAGDEWQVTGYARSDGLAALFLGFVILVVLISRWRGVMSLISLIFSFVILFYYTVPQIAAGASPLWVAITSSVGIVGSTYYLAHGGGRKTHAAALGTLITIVIVTLLSSWFAALTHLTGFASEEVVFVNTQLGAINIVGLLVAGMVLGAVGVLDDITISQSSIVEELRLANRSLSPFQLYKRAMRVGRDHISSLVNTLVLVYTGSALPLILLFHEANIGYREFVNYEAVAEEIVRMLVGSIGLVLAVPITTVIAVQLTKANLAPKT